MGPGGPGLGSSKAIGSVRQSVISGDANTPEDEADVSVTASLTDVREAGTQLDYFGELQVRGNLRITDRASGPALDRAATVQDLAVAVTVPCAATLDPTAGSDCTVATTLDTVVPGLVSEGDRAIWEVAQLEVLDGGPDGEADTVPNQVFARQGVFIP
jgi:hypothetical protein